MIAESPRCWPLVLFATSTLAAFAPPSAPDEPPATVFHELSLMPGHVVVHDPGVGPRRLLRYAIPHDTSLSFRVALGEPALPIMVTGTCTFSTRDNLVVACTVDSVMLGPSALRGLWLYANLDERGQATSMLVRHDARLARPVAEHVAAAMLQLEPLPDEAVGTGAIWEETALVGVADAKVARTRRVELAGQRGSSIELRTRSTDVSGPQHSLLELQGRGIEQRTVDLTTLSDHLGAYRRGALTTRGPRVERFETSFERSLIANDADR